MTITNNIFDNNNATQSGGIFNSRNMRQKTSSLTITNNTFTNNKCSQNGGVYSFILTDYKMALTNNIYINNSAGLAGGVGYGLRASFALLEESGYYESNSAGTYGGAWYLSANNYKTDLQSFELSQNTFINSTAQAKGGCIYVETGSILIDQCTFQNSQAVEYGGDLYVSIGKTIEITNSTFTGSSAPQGSFIYAEEIDKTLSISGAQISDISTSTSDAVLLSTSSGALSITDTVIENISSPLFQISDVETLIKNITVSQISCPRSSLSFCLLKASAVETLQIINSSFTEVNSNVDLISLSNCSEVLLSNISAQSFLKINTQSLLASDQIYTLNALKVLNLNIENSEFTKIGFSGLKVKNSVLNLQNSNFSNNLKSSRLLAQSFDDSIYSALSSQPIQFLVLDTSSSTLSKIIFFQNSLNTLVNGGAIQILGQGGSHSITDSTFENNQALSGGAIYVQDKADSIQIVNSQFVNNQAIVNGGALIFIDQSVKNSLTISQATFLQNMANLGGAIYLGNQALKVDSSSFIENSALQGGAIATKTSGASTKVQLTQSKFTRNSASQGASLVSLGAMNFEYSTSIFTENKATYGEDLTSIPSYIRLRIYYFDPYFLYIENPTVKDIFAHSSTGIIYDSTTASASESVSFISGSSPNLLFELTIHDAFGNLIGLADNAQGEFAIKSYSSSSSSSVGLLGNEKFTFTNSSAYVFNAFNVKGDFDTTVTLSIKGTYLSQSSNAVQSLPSLTFPIVLDKCSIGQIYDKSKSICSSCSSNTYSLTDPLTTKSCLQCLDNAVCMGGSLMYPAKGYWRIDESSENIIECAQSESCLGGSKDNGKNISLTGFCAEGYEGVACSSCAPGYAKFGSNQSCLDCTESKLYYIMFGGYLLIQAVAIISTVRINLKGSKTNISSKRNAVLQSTLLKIVIDFVQILTLTSEFNFNFPQVVGYLLDGVSKIIPTNIDALSVDCFIALEKGSNKHIFFNKVLVILSEPFAYMLFAYLAWTLLFKIRRETISRNPDFKSKMVLTCIVIIYILQPGIIKIMFELFNCKNYGSIADPKYYLVYDVQVECWRPGHLSWALGIGVPTIIFGLVAPFAILAYWTRDKDLLSSSKVQKQYTFIFKSYNKNAVSWEVAILARKVLLILISVFITSQYLQAYLGFLLLVLFFKASYRISPYTSPELNLAEALSLASSALILYTGLYFARADSMDTIAYMLFAIDIISGIVFVAYCLYVFFKIFKNSAFRRNLTNIGSKIITGELYGNLKLAIHSHAKQQTLTPVTFPSPTSEEPNSADTPTGRNILLSSDRFMSSERPFMPKVKTAFARQETIDRDGNSMSERRAGSDTEIQSPANQTGIHLVSWKRGVKLSPLHFREVGSPSGKADDESGDFSEILERNVAQSPVESADNQLSKVLKFSKELWIETLSKKNSQDSSN